MAENSQFTESDILELQRQIEALRRELNANPDTLTSFGNDDYDAVGIYEPLNGSRLSFSEDNMSVWLYLNPPEAGKSYQKEEILDFLRSMGVVTGFHTSNIAAVLKKNIYHKEVLVAAGMNPREGRDGYYEFMFSPHRLNAPMIRSDGSVDYSTMGMLQNVAKGDIVAVYHRAVQGASGYTVKGEECKCKPARELPPIRGRNIRRLEDGITYVSEVDGKVEVKDDKIDVQNVHEVRGDVTNVIGKVEFYGDIIIYGNVETGVTIRAGRNIIIKGITEAVNIYAGGDVTFEKGLVGGKKAAVSARGCVFGDFVENASIEAKGDVTANIIMNSKISANGKVILTGQKGTLIGGYTHGLMGVEAANMGNDVEVKTIIHAGFDSKTYMKYIGLCKKEQEINQMLERTVEEMSAILKSRSVNKRMTPDTELRLMELNRKKDECFAAVDDMKIDKEIVNELMMKGKGAVIAANGPIHRGVVVCIENARMLLEHSTCYMKYFCVNGYIKGQVIVV